MTTRKKLVLFSLLSYILILLYNIYHAFWWYHQALQGEEAGFVHIGVAMMFILCCGIACVTVIPLIVKLFALFFKNFIFAIVNAILDLPFFLLLNWWFLITIPSKPSDALYFLLTLLAALCATAALALDILSVIYCKSESKGNALHPTTKAEDC